MMQPISPPWCGGITGILRARGAGSTGQKAPNLSVSLPKGTVLLCPGDVQRSCRFFSWRLRVVHFCTFTLTARKSSGRLTQPPQQAPAVMPWEVMATWVSVILPGRLHTSPGDMDRRVCDAPTLKQTCSFPLSLCQTATPGGKEEKGACYLTISLRTPRWRGRSCLVRKVRGSPLGPPTAESRPGRPASAVTASGLTQPHSESQ